MRDLSCGRWKNATFHPQNMAYHDRLQRFPANFRQKSQPAIYGQRYDRLVRKFRQGIGAMGFALYLSDLGVYNTAAEYDCDLLLLYGEDTPAAEVLAMAEEERAKGLSVRIERSLPKGLRAKETREI